MQARLIVFLIMSAIFLSSLTGQNRIHFIENISIENAFKLAEKQGKGVFVDTYADWCIPCKKMEIEFKNPDLSSFMNANYINVRIDMDDSQYAQEYRNRFSIVFLPTMVVMDYLGNIKFKADKIIPSRELLSIAEGSLEQGVYFSNEASEVASNPFNNKQVSKEQQVTNSSTSPTTQSPPSQPKAAKPPSTPSKGRIVYSVGDGEINPDYLRREAYFRIELMDGSHRTTAEKYLATQDDLSTDTNVRFMYDFLHNVHSSSFQYMAENREIFEEKIGKDEVAMTIQFMVQNELDNGYPRPSFEEAQELLYLVDTAEYKVLTYQYYLDRLLEVCDYQEYRKLGLQYLNETNRRDEVVFFNIAEMCYLNEDSKSELKKCKEWLQNALKEDEDNIFYQDLMAKILIKMKNKKKARKVARKLIELAAKFNHDASYYLHLQEQAENL